MGLKIDIKNAFIKSLGPDAVGEGNLDELAGDLKDAIINFLQAQTFTITELKAIVEMEEIKTTGPLQADVLPSVTIASNIAPGTVSIGAGAAAVPTPTPIPVTGNVSTGDQGVLIPPVDLSNRGGQGGALQTTGHAYIGNKSPKGETNEDLTKVRLIDVVAE